jgi:hypothetical protein
MGVRKNMSEQKDYQGESVFESIWSDVADLYNLTNQFSNNNKKMEKIIAEGSKNVE